MTAWVPPSVLLHIAYHCLMVIVVGIHVYSLSASSTIIPDLPVLYGLVVAFIVRLLFYLPDIRHVKLLETQRLLNEVGK